MSLEPDRSRAGELAREANLIPLIAREIQDTETPVSAFLKLRNGSPAYLLESAEQGRLGRYSFLGFRPRSLLRWEAGTLSEWSGEKAAEWTAGATPPPTTRTAAADPYSAVSEFVESHKLADLPGLPPFPGGAVGFFGYDLVRTVEPLGEPNPDPLGLPDLALMVCEVMVVFDHLAHELIVIAYMFVEDEADLDAEYERAAGTIAEVQARLRAPIPRGDRGEAGSPGGGAESKPVPTAKFESNLTQAAFEANVGRAIEYIHAGDVFQVVPSQRFIARTSIPAFSIYRGLRAVNPSPYMYFLEFGDFQIAGASPEPLVKVTGRRVETRPIAGTYPRGGSGEEDRRRAAELLSDPKERAEHVMLVDLGRNDLGRVCEYGSVTVDELMAVETYSHVLHIVSQVSGTLREGATAMDALRAALPAGTLSGAPKVRAMEIIDELEPHKRGSYGGAIGYLSFNGDLDTAIHIRTVVAKDGQIHVQAGSGTVADSEPGYEYRESIQKAKAIFAAVELAAGQPEWT